MAQALSLKLVEASDQYASITDASQTGLDPSGDFTFEGNVKISAFASGKVFGLIDKWDGTGNNRSYRVNLQNNGGTHRLNGFLSDDGSSNTEFAINFLSNLELNRWYHIAVTYDASAGEVELFLDGVTQGTDGSQETSLYAASTAPVLVGGNTGTTARYPDAIYKDFRFWSEERTAAQILANKNLTTIADTTNLEARWLFDGDYTDETANGNDLTATNSPFFVPEVPLYTDDFSGEAKITIDNTKVSGSSDLTDYPVLFADGNFVSGIYTNAKKFTDQCLDLEASSSQYAADTSPSADLQITGDLTVECSVKFKSLPSNGDMILVGHRNPGGTGRTTYQIQYADNAGSPELNFFHRNNSDNTDRLRFTLSETPALNRWYHVACTVDGSTVTFYLDGYQAAASQTLSNSRGSSASNDLWIGSQAGSAAYLDGKIKDVRIWSEARAQKDVASYMNQELAGTETNLEGYWKLDNSYADETANGNDLTGSGSPVFATDAPRGGADLRFTTDEEGTTEIPCEIVSWDGDGTSSEVYVKIPTVSYNTDTEIFVWYGNDGATFRPLDDAYGQYAVWSDYVAVYHMQESGYDSTGNMLTGTEDSITYGSGKIGNAAQSNSSSDDITVADDAALDVTDLGISLWIKTSHSGSQVNLFSRFDDNVTERSFRIEMQSGGGVLFLAYDQTNNNAPTMFTSSVNDGNWHHIVANAYVDSGDLEEELYEDGSLADSGTYSGGTSVQKTSSSLVMLGATGTISGIGTADLDEVRMSGVSRTSDWIATEYANQNAPDTFATGSSLSETKTATIQAKARVKNLGLVTDVQAKARVSQLSNEEYIQAKARVSQTGNAQSVQAKGRLTGVPGAKTVTAKASIFNTLVRSIRAKANILTSQMPSISSRGRLRKSNESTVTSKSRINKTGNVISISAKGRIMQFDQPIQITAKAALKKAANSYTIQTRTRINVISISTITAKSRIRGERKGFIGMPSTHQSFPITMDDARFLN